MVTLVGQVQDQVILLGWDSDALGVVLVLSRFKTPIRFVYLCFFKLQLLEIDSFVKLFQSLAKTQGNGSFEVLGLGGLASTSQRHLCLLTDPLLQLLDSFRLNNFLFLTKTLEPLLQGPPNLCHQSKNVLMNHGLHNLY